MNTRLLIAAMALSIGIGGIAGAAHAAPPALTVTSVLPPEPPGTEPGSQMLLQATVKARSAFGSAAQVTFYLAENPVSAPGNIPIATATVPLLPAIFGETISATASVPDDVTPGFYYLLGCVGGNCAVTPYTIQVLGQSLSEVEPPGGTAQTTATGKEYFPERPADGLSVGGKFECPYSSHGQSPGLCVWVTSGRIPVTLPDTGTSLMYCPSGFPYPFQVFLGNDPLWNDLSGYPKFAKTNGVSNTKYNTDFFGAPLSYSGLDPNDSGRRGYAAFRFYCGSNECLRNFTGQVEYLCSTRESTSALP
jgi:hypothetical protein